MGPARANAGWNEEADHLSLQVLSEQGYQTGQSTEREDKKQHAIHWMCVLNKSEQIHMNVFFLCEELVLMSG